MDLGLDLECWTTSFSLVRELFPRPVRRQSPSSNKKAKASPVKRQQKAEAAPVVAVEDATEPGTEAGAGTETAGEAGEEDEGEGDGDKPDKPREAAKEKEVDKQIKVEVDKPSKVEDSSELDKLNEVENQIEAEKPTQEEKPSDVDKPSEEAVPSEAENPNQAEVDKSSFSFSELIQGVVQRLHPVQTLLQSTPDQPITIQLSTIEERPKESTVVVSTETKVGGGGERSQREIFDRSLQQHGPRVIPHDDGPVEEEDPGTVIQKIKKLKHRAKRGVLHPISTLRYFGITLREPRTLQVIHPTPEAYSVIVSVIKSVWKPGIAQVKNDYNQEVCDIKLNGSPFWFSFSNEFALQVHFLVLKLIDKLDKSGFQLILATDLARYFELSTLFFTEKPPRGDNDEVDRRSQFMSVTISHNNQLQLANCSLSNKLAITQLITNTWHYGISKEISLPSGYILILNGGPWCNKKLAFSARSLLHQLTLLLTQRNWNLVTSARIKNHRDSLIFQYEPTSPFDWDSLHATFLSLSLSEKDKLRVIHCSDMLLIQDLKEIIMKIWKPGLINDYKKSGGHEFVLAEKPWWCESTEAIKTRYFMCDMLELLYARGFKIHASIECHPELIEKTTLTFKKGPARRVKVVCLSFDENDKVRIINGPQIFVNAVRSVLSNRVGPEGIQKEREFLKSVEFTLNDLNIWDGRQKRDSQVGKSICCHILQKVGELGWCVVLSADTTSAVKGNNNRHDIPMDVHSWYLIQLTTTSKAFHKLRKGKLAKDNKNNRESEAPAETNPGTIMSKGFSAFTDSAAALIGRKVSVTSGNSTSIDKSE